MTIIKELKYKTLFLFKVPKLLSDF